MAQHGLTASGNMIQYDILVTNQAGSIYGDGLGSVFQLYLAVYSNCIASVCLN
jgi:hypothetical protein